MNRFLTARSVGARLASILVLILVVGVFAGPVAAKTRRPMRGSYTVTAAPAPDGMATYCGVAPFNKSPHPLDIPAPGFMNIKLDGFRGDWDLWLETDDAKYVDGSYTSDGLTDDSAVERITTYIKKPGRYVIWVCNWAGSPEARVTYEVRFGAKKDVVKAPPILLQERVPVNYVFVGYEQKDVKAAGFRKELPRESRPVVRSRTGAIREADVLPIRYSFDHRLKFASRPYENLFFNKLKKLSEPAELTLFQTQYNAQTSKRLEIDDNNLIDAVAVEEWLARHPPKGVDTRHDTVFFINWFERKDFEFHLYSKSGDPDPDNGIDHGLNDGHKTIAWGGTPPEDPEDGYGVARRVWFYDLSAGPEWRTGNWAVDAPSSNYFMPPIWEYHKKGFRKPGALTSDLAKVARWVAIDLLFTPSPLYPPDLTPPRLPSKINLDLNTYEGVAGVDASENFVNPKIILRNVRQLQPLNKFTLDEQDLDFHDPRNLECYGAYSARDVASAQGAYIPTGPSCYPERPYPMWANLFVLNGLTLDTLRDDQQTADYEATALLYAGPPTLRPGWGGYADDNYRDGTQSFTYSVSTPPLNASAAGTFTSTAIHEYGHHLGLSHTHDGYDWERQTHFGPVGNKFFAWVGNESNSVMNYLSNTDEFSQFDFDNMSRWLAAVHLEHAQAIVGDVKKAGGADKAARDIVAVKSATRRSQKAFAAHRYFDAWREARRAYNAALRAAKRVGIEVVGSDAGTHVEDTALTPESSWSSMDPTFYIDPAEGMYPQAPVKP